MLGVFNCVSSLRLHAFSDFQPQGEPFVNERRLVIDYSDCPVIPNITFDISSVNELKSLKFLSIALNLLS